jgi:hypothetical protein
VRAQGGLGTAFTYQGQLKSGGEPVNEDCEMAFRLYDGETGGSQVGSAITKTVPISDGLFTVLLDFGSSVFAGDARWLGIQVQCPGDVAYADLGRQALTATPYALYATRATTATYALGSGDADTLDGLHASAFVTSSHPHPGTDISSPVTEAISATWATTATYALGSGDADTLDGLHGDVFWQVGGNAGTTPGVDYLGTSDGVTLTLAVSGTAALRLVPHATSPNVIGGHGANSVAAGAAGATIGGGGDGTYPNRVTGGTYGTVGGGRDNTASDDYATVGGGQNNTASLDATVAGGRDNTASLGGATVGGGGNNTASAFDATVGGGRDNTASGNRATVAGGRDNTADGGGATVGGGYLNTASDLDATVGGGRENTASGERATVGGGYIITASGDYATVAGGWYNTASGDYATVAGGDHNTASDSWATVGGGWYNTASGGGATIGGGYLNAASGIDATIGGGRENAASGDNATVAGGYQNTAAGAFSFAAGRRAKAVHQGAFVWADSTDVDYTSTITDQFAIRASNGVSLSVNAGGSKAIAVGERYRDNAVIAWARVASGGSTNGNSFGVESVARIGTGQYAITVTAQTASADLLIPMAVAEVDAPVPLPLPIVLINQISARRFEVYVFDVFVMLLGGPPELMDNDFVFMVTGR